jgi:anti-repressor protein
MQHQLIPVTSTTIGTESIPTVNARDLHEFLGIGKDFSSWIKDQIVRVRLIENRDFVTFTQKGERKEGVRGASISIEYHLTMESGKRIGMMSNTDKGFEIQDYFLACEKQVQAQNESPQMLMARALIAADSTIKHQNEHIAVLEHKIEEQQPKAAFFDAVANSSSLILIREVAKILAVPHMGQNMLYDILRGLKVLMKNNEPYQTYVNSGYFMVRERQYTIKGEVKVSRTTMVTQKGLDFIRRLAVKNMKGGFFKKGPAVWEMPEEFMLTP